MRGHSYNAAERILHYLALGSQPIAEITFDLNLLLSSSDSGAEADERPVFVSGLARAGTTIVMRRLYQSGLFRSLTYRDMPFVLCPNLWQHISAHSRRDVAAVERAHGDRLLVDVDSPEALDEVFWRVFAGVDYIQRDHLRAHAADAELIVKFRRYVCSILSSGSDPRPGKRYLSKNNNNILRLGSLQAAFPRSTILIPFRDPLQQAISLLNQHARFCRLQQENRFARSYMSWLAHHEFGREHKPFWLDTDCPFTRSAYSENEINYWLETWLRVYGHIQMSRPANSIPICYEDLCSDPAAWDAIRERIGVDSHSDPSHTPFSRAVERTAPGTDGQLVDRAYQLYGALRAEFMQAIG